MFLGLGVVLVGAWLGFWGVRKMVLAEDGNIDSGVAKFVKWAIRVIGGAMLLQVSVDSVHWQAYDKSLFGPAVITVDPVC